MSIETFSFVLICVFIIIIPFINLIMNTIHARINEPCKNPLVDDSAEDRFYEAYCRKYGCVTTGSYYVGMPQATCCRCGHRNYCAQPQIKEWRLPDRYDKE